jgi:DNA-binding transcriptional regulator YdaS (Cro superfamily)
MTDLSGKVAVVTGASRGIGQAVAVRLGQLGASVVVNYSRDASGAAATVAEIEAAAHGHVNPAALAQRLKNHGVKVRASRNAALIALAADLPTPLLSTLFGLSIRSAVQWTRRAGRDWTAYIAAHSQMSRQPAEGQRIGRKDPIVRGSRHSC